MHLSTLVDLLEEEAPGLVGASGRMEVGKLMAERGHHDEAAAQYRAAVRRRAAAQPSESTKG